jgi:hypothetical protein
VSRRIDIELTSAQPDGTWTWRAAGARQPKGVLDGQVLYQGAKAGDVVRAEADFEIEGITIVSVMAPKEKKRSEPERIELLTPSGPAVGGVTTQLVGKTGGRGRRDFDGFPREGGRDGGPRTGGPGRTGGAPRGGGPRSGGPREGGRPEGRGPGGGSDRPAGGDRPRTDRPAGERPRNDRPARTDRPVGARASEGRGPRREGGEGRPSNPAERSRGRRLNPANVHRQAVLEALPPEQQPIAEQLLRGGIPAVRTAIALEKEKASAEGRQAPNAEQLLTLAEQILPSIKGAEWRDRAEAAAASLGDISLRDLRSVVAGADAARDDETRALAASLREALDTRVNGLRTTWTDEIERHLTENRVVRALRLAGRPPETSARVPAELSERLATTASAALTADTPGERWVALLEAVAESPVRRSVKPVALPTGATPEVIRAAHQQAGRVPALAGLLGIAIPPPPGPRRPAGSPPPRPPSGGRIPAPPASSGAVPASTEVPTSAEPTEPVTEAEPAAVAEPVTEAEPAAVAEPVTEPEPAAVAEPVTEAEPAAVPEPVTEAEPVAAAEPAVTESESSGDAAAEPVPTD